jgi:hypothetical protein
LACFVCRGGMLSDHHLRLARAMIISFDPAHCSRLRARSAGGYPTSCARRVSLACARRGKIRGSREMTEATQVTQTDSDSRSKRIVVGHDGSGGAGEALRMALTLADLLQASVRLARAWSMTTAPRRPEWEFGYMPSFDEMSVAAMSSGSTTPRPTSHASLMCHLTTEPSMPARRSPSSSSHATP